MNRTRPALLFALLLLGSTLAGCQSGPAGADTARQRLSAERDSWIERRAAQLSASGISSGDAAARAAAEWASRTGDQSDTWTLYDSSAKAKAEQQKVQDGLEKMQRGN